MELSFRQMKSRCRPDQVSSLKPAAVEALTPASAITQILGGELLVALRRRRDEQARRLREERGAALFATVASVLDVMAKGGALRSL